MSSNEIYSPFFGVLGASTAMILAAFGAAYGTAKSGTAISTSGTLKPETVIKSLIPVVMAGIIAIYGLVVSVLIANSITSSYKGYTSFKGYLHFAGGTCVGTTGLAAGYAIGLVGDAGVRGTVQQPKMFVGMILILIFCEVLGLYGLIVGLMLSTK